MDGSSRGTAGDPAASATPASLTDLTAAAREGWAAENRAAARRLVACYELYRECTRQEEVGAGDGSPPGHAVVDPFVAATGYVVAAMAISSLRAEAMISFAWDLHTRYPAILEALSAGRMDLRAAESLARQMATVDAEVLPLVQRKVVDDYLDALEAGERLGAKTMRERADAIIARHDADGIRRRRDEAARARGVRLNKGRDGMSTLSAVLANEEAAVLAEAIDQRVAEHADDDEGAAAGEECFYSKAERRADALLSLACGDRRRAGTPDQPPAPLRPRVTVLAGRSDSDDRGDAATVEFTRSGQAALHALLAMLATSDGASFERVDPRIGAADDARRALRYKPSAELARRIRLRDGTCRHPGCAVPADDCDVDHVRPFDHADPARGGHTEECNLMCLCRRHHRFKTFSDWVYDLQPDGTLIVTSPEGTTTMTRPSGPLGAYRREQAHAETAAWDAQQRRSPDPSTAGSRSHSEPTYWSRRAARLAAERDRTAHPAGTGPGSPRPSEHGRWWRRNAPVASKVEQDVRALLDELLDPPPF